MTAKIGVDSKLKSRNVAIQVIVLAYSMFGVIGLSSQMLSPSPIMYAIGSGLAIFAYSTIAVLSTRLSFRELFSVLMPLNIINAIKSYVELGYFYLKYQPFFDQVSNLGNLVLEAAKKNVTLTSDYLTDNLGSDVLRFNLSIPYKEKFVNFVNGVPDWVAVVLFILILGYMGCDLILSVVSNLFAIITLPIVFAVTSVLIVSFNLNISYIYFALRIWIPIATTIDSFLRVYILRKLFFKFMKNHPLIKTYAEVSN